MAKKVRPGFDRIRLSVEVKTHRVYTTTSGYKDTINAYDGLNELERELFACGAEVVDFDGRTYRKTEDRVRKDDYDKIIRTFEYKLKR